jgi:hypothetical protein
LIGTCGIEEIGVEAGALREPEEEQVTIPGGEEGIVFYLNTVQIRGQAGPGRVRGL